MNESPLFTKTYDFLMWLIPQAQKFPRTYRFTLAERIQVGAMEFQDLITAAGKRKGAKRLEYLQDADTRLEQLRIWLRFSRDNQLITVRQFEHASRSVSEMGRLLGAWIKNVAQA